VCCDSFVRSSQSLKLSVKIADEYNAAKISQSVPGKTAGERTRRCALVFQLREFAAERRPTIEDEDVSCSSLVSALLRFTQAREQEKKAEKTTVREGEQKEVSVASLIDSLPEQKRCACYSGAALLLFFN
jgi:hypothetical protein